MKNQYKYLTATLRLPNGKRKYVRGKTKEELETALSIITTSYERCDDTVQAVRENNVMVEPFKRSTDADVIVLNLEVRPVI